VQGLVAAGLWLGLDIGPEHTLGMGEATIGQILLRGSAGVGPIELWWGMALALCARALNTVLTIQSGGSAGMLVPTMVMGGVAGALTCTLLQPLIGLQLDPALFAVVGIASALVAVVGVPLSAMALVLEVFGKEFGPPSLLAVGVTYLITLKLRSGDPP
jgi:CIC family chloride channel protein